jgi:hypothetical protein
MSVATTNITNPRGMMLALFLNVMNRKPTMEITKNMGNSDVIDVVDITGRPHTSLEARAQYSMFEIFSEAEPAILENSKTKREVASDATASMMYEYFFCHKKYSTSEAHAVAEATPRS